MDNKTMVIPFQPNFDLLSKCRKASTALIVSVSILSIAIPVFNNFGIVGLLNYISNLLNFVLIICYYILFVSTDIFIYPATARERRRGFFDNSFNSKLSDRELVNYFSNDNIPFGPFKMAVNCFENCYFTYNIAKRMTKTIIVKNAILFLLFLIIAFIGFSNNVIALPILQIFLSSLFLTELIHHLNFINRLKSLCEQFRRFFENDINKDDYSYPSYLMLEYETVLAYNKSPLSDRIYEETRTVLSQGWEEQKRRYAIG